MTFRAQQSKRSMKSGKSAKSGKKVMCEFADAVGHNAIKWQVVCPPPNTNRFSASEPSHDVLSDSFMRVRRQALDDLPDHYSNPRVKRACSSTKNATDPAASSTCPYHVMPIKSTSSVPQWSTCTCLRRTDLSR